MEVTNSADVLSQSPVSDSLVTEYEEKCEVESTDGLTKDVEGENGDADDEMIFLPKMKKTRKLAVSDSDDDDIPSHPTKQICNVDLEQQLESIPSVRANQNKFIQEKTFYDSDDQSKSGSTDKENVRRKRSRIKPVWISCSDDDESSSNDHSNGNAIISNHSKENQEADLSDKELDKQHSHQQMRKKLKKKRTFDHDSDQENSSAGEREFTKSAQKSKIKLASMLEEGDESNSEDEHVQSNAVEESSSPFSRNSKLSPKEGMQKIHSESQRMVRESSVCLPYHKPKQRSLMDFLNRKRVTPSNEDRIKPRPRDLEAVVQVLEDRAKEVEDFFKSESEDSEHEQQGSLSSNKQSPVPLTQELPDAVDSLPVVFMNSTEDISVKDAMECDKRKPPIADCSADSQLVSREDVEMKSPLRNLDVAAEGNNLDKTDQLAFKLGSEIPKEPTAVKSDESNDSWLEYSTVFSHKEKVENIKRLSVAKVNKPTLHGRPGQLLDLEVETTTSDQKVKVNNLIERFVQQVTNTKKSPQKKDVQISIVQKVMNADGQLELKKEVLNVPVDNTSEGQCASAGRRQLLKDSLRQSMSAKRAVDRMKKTENQKLENEDYQSEGKIDSEPEEILSDDPDSELEDEEEDDEDEQIYKEKRKKLRNKFLEEEAEDSDQENLEDDVDEEDIEIKTKLGKDQFVELEDVAREPAKNEGNFDKNESRVDYSPPVRSELKLSFKSSGLFSSLEDLTPNLDDTSNSSEEGLIPKLKSTQTTESANVDELLALCSGKFPDATQGGTQKSSLDEKADDEFEEDVKGFSRIVPVLDDDDDSCSGSNLKLLLENDAELESGIPPLFSDDEDEKSKPKKKKKRTRICLSDDEDGNEDEERSVIDEEEMHEEEREFRGLTDFFEDEAELSGSEVGSGDEREDEEDDWEQEEGDKEDIDENEVREQVGRAHMKTLLDQDQREVRLFQELFLEDGDLHSEGGGRQRQFRWKNADGEEIEGDGPRRNTQEEVLDPEADDQDDLTWRKMRSEREKWLQQQKSQQEANKDVPLVMKRNGKTVKVNTTFKATLNPPEKGDTSAAAAANPKPYMSPKKNMPNIQVRRGSFLRRSEKDLSALASLTKSVLPVQAPKMGSNFVFASITPERPTTSEEKRKFKLEGSKEDTSNQNPAPAKKAKVSLSSKSIFSYF